MTADLVTNINIRFPLTVLEEYTFQPLIQRNKEITEGYIKYHPFSSSIIGLHNLEGPQIWCSNLIIHIAWYK